LNEGESEKSNEEENKRVEEFEKKATGIELKGRIADGKVVAENKVQSLFTPSRRGSNAAGSGYWQRIQQK
jgi:hypothetical protein